MSEMACSQHYVSLLIVPSPFSLSSGIISATFCCFVLCNSSSICSGRMGTPTTEPIKSGRHINRVRNRCFIDTKVLRAFVAPDAGITPCERGPIL
jgi:hypothetical protein